MPHSRAIQFLRDYVAIPSVNPMRRDDMDPAIVGERAYAEHVQEQLRRLRVDAELIGPDDRPSVIGEVAAPGATSTIVVASHLDTVPVDGMEVDPFDPEVAGGRLFGRGSCDTKSGMAALIAAVADVLERGTLRRNVIVVGESDEELGSLGARAVVEHLRDRSRPVDWAIATEPTSLRLVTHHKGVVHARLVATGVAGHSSAPERGRNAIVALAKSVLALDHLADSLSEKRDARLGAATLSVGVVEGGNAPNMIPDHAALVLDRRTLPGEGADSVRDQLEARLAAESADDVTIEWCREEKAPLGTDASHTSVRACQQALASQGLDPDPTTAAFGTDGGVFEVAGIPSVVLGPGSIEQAHTVREWVDVDQVDTMTAVMRELLESP